MDARVFHTWPRPAGTARALLNRADANCSTEAVRCAPLDGESRAFDPRGRMNATGFSAPRRALRVGFLPLADAAPLAVARELGFFTRRGIEVQAQREIGWATIRDKLVYGEIDAAVAPAPMLWSMRLGLGCPVCEVLTALVLSRHGGATVLAQHLWREGVRDGASLQRHLKRRNERERFSLGISFDYSSDALLWRSWVPGLAAMGNVQFVVMPPMQMAQWLASGAIQGFCAGEPWCSAAIQRGAGWCPTWSAALTPGVPEKVLIVRRSFAEDRSVEHAALISALVEACAWAEEPANRTRVADMLADKGCLNVSRDVLLPALTGRFDCGHGEVQTVADFLMFHGCDTNIPSVRQARDLQRRLVAAGMIGESRGLARLPARLFREDIHRNALAAAGVSGATTTAPITQRMAG